MPLGYGRLKNKAPCPSSHSSNRNVLLLFCEGSKIARDHPSQRPGDKDSFSLQRVYYLLKYEGMCLYLLKQYSLQSSTLHCSLKNEVFKFRSRPLACCQSMPQRNRDYKDGHLIGCVGSSLLQCRIVFFFTLSNHWSLLKRGKVCWDCFHQLLFVPGSNKRELLGAVFIVDSEEPTFLSHCLLQFAT